MTQPSKAAMEAVKELGSVDGRRGMKTAKEVEAEFKLKLAALLAEYSQPDWKADLSVEERSCMGGWDSYGVMTVYIPPAYDQDGNMIREGADFELPTIFDKDDAEVKS